MVSMTISSSSLAPSPTAWIHESCYTENPTKPLMDHYLSPAGGDKSPTVPKCQDDCNHRGYSFTGVQWGNQCWYGTYIGGEWTKNQTDCNMPCTGDKATFCGGMGVLSIFQAQENEETVPSATPPTTTTATASVITGSAAAEASAVIAGAVKNRALFGLDF